MDRRPRSLRGRAARSVDACPRPSAARLLLAELLAEFRPRRRRERRRSFAALAPEQVRWLRSIETKGFAVIERYLAGNECERLCAEMEQLLVRYEKRVQRNSAGADERLLGVDRVSPGFRAFWEIPGLRLLRQAYAGNDRNPGFTMANRIRATSGNLGSGNGWHRDSAQRRRFKAIVYLNDVDSENGPLQYCRGSHRLLNRLSTSLRLRTSWYESRFDDGSYDRFFETSGGIETLTAPRGSLILIDPTGIHRGRPLSRGVRYAMTNYYLDHPIPADWPVLDETIRCGT